MEFYLYYKLLHFIGVVMWMGGLFTLASQLKFLNNQSDPFRESLFAYSRKIYFSMNLPGVILTIVFGLLMVIVNTSVARGGWFHAKMLFVIGLLIVDHITLRKLKTIAGETVSEGSLKWFHPVIGILFLITAAMASLKPF